MLMSETNCFYARETIVFFVVVLFTSDDPAMVNFNKPRSSELLLVVIIDRTFSNEAILVN